MLVTSLIAEIKHPVKTTPGEGEKVWFGFTVPGGAVCHSREVTASGVCGVGSRCICSQEAERDER